MFEHKYDESGLPTSYVLLTIVILLIIYKVYNAMMPDFAFQCNCSKCRENKAKKPYKYDTWILLILFVILAVLTKNVLTLKMKNVVDPFNPYVVLGIDETWNLKKTKKRYRMLLKPLFRKAKIPKLKAEAEKEIIKINKAFDLIKDPQNYQKFLESQTKKELFVAIPQYILDFSNLSFVFYFGFLSIILPFIIWMFIKKNKNKTENGVYYTTNEAFFEICGEIDISDKLKTLYEILYFISDTDDFKMYQFKKDLTCDNNFKNILENIYHIPYCGGNNAAHHIIALLIRSKHTMSVDIDFVQETLLHIIHNYQIIALNENEALYEYLLDLERMVIHRIPHYKFSSLQFIPLMSPTEIQPFVKQSNNTLEDEIADSNAISSFDKEAIMQLISNMPEIQISKIQVFTYDEDTFSKNIPEEEMRKIEIENTHFVIPKGKSGYVAFKATFVANDILCHTPFCSTPVYLRAVLIGKLNGKLITNIIELDPKYDREIKLPLPNKAGLCKFEIKGFVKGYFGLDVIKTVTIRYK